VLVVGDLMLDRYVSGPVTRISPESPVPVVQVEREWAAVGGAANVAANVVALGARCDVVGCVGSDDAGCELRERLRGLGVGIEGLVETAERPTTVKTRVMAGHQQVVRIDREDSHDVSPEAVRLLRMGVRRGLASCASVVLEDYDKGVLVPAIIRETLEGAKAEGVPTIVDPKRRRFFGYGSATVFKPNAKELEDALGEPVRPEEAGWMEGARLRLDCEHLLLTLGRRGMALCSASGGTTLFPASDRGVFDVSGAGDTVSAVVALALALGASMSDAVVLANGAAAVQVSKAGVATVTREELYEHASTLTTALEVGGTPREVADLPRGERSSRELSGTPER
jgi:D-beta-D-heptose 7-phosphate kinase/D-beta-D-heptose 1-phosphate adenosyltransferase